MIKPQLYLASSSPQRAALLTQLGLHFSTLPVRVDEKYLAGESVMDHVKRLAIMKARAGWAYGGRTDILPVLGGDTIICQHGEILGKPQNFNSAKMMWNRLSNTTHQVITAIAVVQDTTCLTEVVTSEVTMRAISEQEQVDYWRSGEPVDKAGAYAIQGLGSIFISRIVGSYSAIVGLPLFECCQLLAKFQIHPLHAEIP